MASSLIPEQGHAVLSNRVLRTLSMALAAVLIVTTLASRISLVDTHLLNVMGEEQNVVYGVIKWMQGTPLYSDPEVLPMDIIQYAPGYYYLVGGLGMVVGVDASEPQAVYALSRTVGLLLNVIFAILGYRICRLLGAQPWAGILWAAVLFSFLPRQIYSRPDALNLVFFALSMGFFLRHLRLRDREGNSVGSGAFSLTLATVLGCCAALSKQTGVLPLAIIGFWLLFNKEWKHFAQQSLVGLVALGCAIALLFWNYGFHVIIANLVTSVRNGIDLAFVRTLIDTRFIGMFCVQLIALVIAIRWWRRADSDKRGWAFALLISMVFGYLTSLKYGSSAAYYMEGMLLATAGMAWVMSHKDVGSSRGVQWVALVVAILFINPKQLAWGVTVLRGNNTVENERVDYEQAKAMAAELKSDPELREGYVLFPYHDHLENFIVGRSVLTQKDIYQLPTSIAHYDLSEYRKALNDGSIRLILKRDLSIPLCIVGDVHPPLIELGVRHGYHIYLNSASQHGRK